MSTQLDEQKKVTLLTLRQKKRLGKPISMLTAYDYNTAMLLDQAGIDSILVGDSLGMVVLGYETTLPVTMDDMLHHCKAVARGSKRAFLIGDMPFMSYQVSVEEAVRNAGRFLQEAGMDAVKLEGGRERIDAVRAISEAGIPVMGHIGLTPQSVHKFGGFRVQGNRAAAAKRLVEDALLLQEAGAFGIVLEGMPEKLGALITSKLEMLTIGIGAGPACDGQVLVLHDMLGLFERFKPRFAKQFATLAPEIRGAAQGYINEIESHAFPAAEHTYDMPDEEWQELQKLLGGS
jgi:3-methyl-2-oxobutanoate hydroxymethyltransferase